MLEFSCIIEKSELNFCQSLSTLWLEAVEKIIVVGQKELRAGVKRIVELKEQLGIQDFAAVTSQGKNAMNLMSVYLPIHLFVTFGHTSFCPVGNCHC
jgi:hypothetical protein